MTTPLLNPVQRADLRRILPLVPNARRLAVIAAYLGVTTSELYGHVGLTPRVRNYYLPGSKGDQSWADGMAIAWCWRVARRLGLDPTDLWDIDDGFDPALALSARPPDSPGRIRKGRRPHEEEDAQVPRLRTRLRMAV